MKRIFWIMGVLIAASGCIPDTSQQIVVEGLQQSVKVLRDSAGINHIYAQNQRDLFFAQGYCAARDRLFQFEIWRRQATGTVAEILGPQEIKRDIGTRLFKFRGDMQEEMRYYHSDGVEIITAYTDGVNAYIDEVTANPDLMPLTFKILDLVPQKWTPEVVISRHQGLLGNINNEMQIGRAVARIGEEKVKKYMWFHPKDPLIKLDPAIDGELLSHDILELYQAYRKPVQFSEEHIANAYRKTEPALVGARNSAIEWTELWIGSNNWVTRPRLGKGGHAFMANDPHRTLAVPSLRYWVHLVAPGWNVIGGGEPEIPGVSIGHNEYGAWGLTVYRTDGEDLYVYDLNPENLNQYRYQGKWEDMKVINEVVKVKGQPDSSVDLRYSRHGPVTYIDSLNYKGYAVRCAWMEPGGAPYLASLRMDQAKNWEEFREACNYSHIPGENMIWVDTAGNIGWQAVGIAPLRRNFSGLVPIPGDGRYEWDGYLPIIEKPHLYNPPSGYIATANEDVTPSDYQQWDAVGFQWADPFRGQRIAEVLGSGRELTMNDMQALQTDYLSLPAQQLVPLLANLQLEGAALNAVELLQSWDFRLSPESAQAALYVIWEANLRTEYFTYFPDPPAEEVVPLLQLSTILRMIETMPEAHRAHYLKETFVQALQQLQQKQGSNPENWRYGSPELKHVQIEHALGSIVNKQTRELLNTPLLPRGGNQYTPGATGSNFNQSHGATFKIIVDVKEWDSTLGMNAPGQSGDPESAYYKNLFESWANDGYFTVPYSRQRVQAQAEVVLELVPATK